jgi:hypothetical protein
MALASACGGPTSGTGALQLGGAAPDGEGFWPLPGDVELVPGAQGGFHVWLKLRVSGVAPGRVRLARTARRVSDGRLLLTTEGVGEIGPIGPGGYFEIPAPIPSFLCPSPLGIRVMDERVVFSVEMSDEASAPLGRASAEATPRCPAGDQAAFCARICSG